MPARIHGEGSFGKRTKEYRTWLSMKTRCYNPRFKHYHHYGGRGIRVCDRWLKSYPDFLFDMGRCPDGMSIHRKENDKGYEPGNCVWTDHDTQVNNTRANKQLVYGGAALNYSQWEKRFGLRHGKLSNTVRDGGDPIAILKACHQQQKQLPARLY